MPTKKKKKKSKIDPALALVEAGISKWERERNEKAQKLAEKLADIASDLYANGVTTVKMYYSGENDSGELDCCETDRSFGSYELKPDVENELRDMAWFFVPRGFEINDGGSGTVTFDFVDKKITVEHSQRVVEYENSTEKFSFKDLKNKVDLD